MNRMNFLDKLDYLMERDHLNKSTLSQKSGIPYTTIDAFYKKGYANVKLSTLEKLCACFSTSLDYLVNDKIVDPNYGMIENYETVSSKEEAELLSLFRLLNAEGRRLSIDTIRTFSGNPSMLKEVSDAKAI